DALCEVEKQSVFAGAHASKYFSFGSKDKLPFAIATRPIRASDFHGGCVRFGGAKTNLEALRGMIRVRSAVHGSKHHRTLADEATSTTIGRPLRPKPQGS